VLAVNSAVLGGFVGYSLQKASGSDDARLTYPLLALGAGVGVGASLLVAEEWDVTLSDAWYLSAGAVWPSLGGLLIAAGQNVEPQSDRYTYGIAGGLGGLTLASLALSFGSVSDAGAAFAHSGGFLGLGLGAGTELAILGKTDVTPYKGMGYGAISGVVIGGLLGTQVKGPGSRVFMVDVGAGLGALGGAAIASPLVFGETTEARERAWVAATTSGAILGAAAAYWLTSPSPSGPVAWLSKYGQPMAGVVAISPSPTGNVPAYGLGWSGAF
jgi:hypothetical protein